jgi:hypothetical protein
MGEDYFQPDAKYVEVYLNGEYQGLYLLAESIEESENRLNIKTCYNPDSSNTPFIVELGFAKGDETIFDENLMFMVNDTIPSQCGSTNIIYDLKYPEKFSEVPTLQAEYIKNTMNKLHEGIKVNKPLDKLGIDIQSFINYFLVQELLLIGDFGITSVYYYSNGTTIFAGPAWDFDNISSMPATGFLQPEADNTLYRGLLQYPEFKEAFIKRFDEVYPKLVSALSSKIDHMKNNKLLNDAVTKHDGLYNRNSRTDLSGEWWAQNPAADNIHSFTNHLNYIQHWLLDGLDTESEGRLEWLKNHIDEL